MNFFRIIWMKRVVVGSDVIMRVNSRISGNQSLTNLNFRNLITKFIILTSESDDN